MKKPFNLEEAVKHPKLLRLKDYPDWRALWIIPKDRYIYIGWDNSNMWHVYDTSQTDGALSPNTCLYLETPLPINLAMTVDDIKKLPANAWVKRKTHSRWYRITSIDDDGIYLYGDGFMTHTTFYAGYKYTLDGGETWNEFAPEV